MATLNKCFFIGRFTENPTLRMTQNSIPVCEFTLAIQRKGKQDIAEFLDFQTWRGQAEFTEKYFKKGTAAFIEAEARVERWQDKDLKWHKKQFYLVSDIQFAEPKQRDATETSDFEEMSSDDELPF